MKDAHFVAANSPLFPDVPIPNPGLLLPHFRVFPHLQFRTSLLVPTIKLFYFESTVSFLTPSILVGLTWIYDWWIILTGWLIPVDPWRRIKQRLWPSFWRESWKTQMDWRLLTLISLNLLSIMPKKLSMQVTLLTLSLSLFPLLYDPLCLEF